MNEGLLVKEILDLLIKELLTLRVTVRSARDLGGETITIEVSRKGIKS